MLYDVPKVGFGKEIVAHSASPLTEENGFNQARRARVFPKPITVSNVIKLKSGRVIQPGRGPLLSSYAGYARKSAPYLSRPNLGGITDFFGGIADIVKGGASTVSNVISGAGSVVQPIEKLVQDNPALLSLVKSYVPTVTNPPAPTVVNLTPPPNSSTLGVSNKVWVYGALGMGTVAVILLLRKKRR